MEEKNNKALAEAKTTGKNVIIRKIGMYDHDALYGGEAEMGIVTVYSMATPDGKIIKYESAGY